VDVSVAARHMEVTDAMRDYARDKVSKLPRLYDGLHSADVTFAMEGSEYVVEIVAHGRRKSVFVARRQGKELYACLDQCVHKLEGQLRRHKDRVRDRHGPPHEETMGPGPAPES
jgi:putative sigma-54 modulation protein